MASVRSHISWLSVSEALALAAPDGNSSARLRVLDLGGGAGVDAIRVAQQAHHVTVVDQNSDALAALRRRAQEADVDIEAVQADGESLTQSMFAEKFDVALCHGVVESVADPVALLRSLASVLRPRGVLSVQVPGLAAAMKHLVSLGDVALAGQLLAANVHEWDHAVLGPRRYDPAALTSLMEAAGFSMIGVRGVRVFSDSVPPDLTDDDALRFGALLELEQRLRVQPQFAAGSGGLQALGRLD